MDLKRKSIRVGISAALCMLASNLLKLKFPFFVLLPAVMPISTFFGETLKFGINRIIGTLIGAVIGVMLASIQTENTLLIGLGVIILIYVCNYLKWDSTTSIACLVFVSIMVSAKESAFEYSAHRLLDTFIGIVITTVVNNYVFNPDMKKLLKKQVKNIQKNLLIIATEKNFTENDTELNNIESEINNLKEKLRAYAEAVKLKHDLIYIKNKLDNMVYTLGIAFEQIKMINYINSTKNENIIRDTGLNENNLTMFINTHKNIFFNEINNLDKILEDIS
ncbi:aromatic acid exporter family protein [Clostridium sp. BL-8]|uniref:aromatic acid exporter family protein n=1 Tax=Clostridium sp. BL-8 TaxID=349938 RepID=UPI00098C52C7|nr:aromatic acid exporter family protein [Clostridium sp. BL-8]OOM69673.1 fusaric acid resistance protein family protein [Clostridium sp. BL-8]